MLLFSKTWQGMVGGTPPYNGAFPSSTMTSSGTHLAAMDARVAATKGSLAQQTMPGIRHVSAVLSGYVILHPSTWRIAIPMKQGMN